MDRPLRKVWQTEANIPVAGAVRGVFPSCLRSGGPGVELCLASACPQNCALPIVAAATGTAQGPAAARPDDPRRARLENIPITWKSACDATISVATTGILSCGHRFRWTCGCASQVRSSVAARSETRRGRFAVSPSAAIKLMQRVRATGSAAPPLWRAPAARARARRSRPAPAGRDDPDPHAGRARGGAAAALRGAGWAVDDPRTRSAGSACRIKEILESGRAGPPRHRRPTLAVAPPAALHGSLAVRLCR
jgi:hypothetical protein